MQLAIASAGSSYEAWNKEEKWQDNNGLSKIHIDMVIDNTSKLVGEKSTTGKARTASVMRVKPNKIA